ncbi:MAG: bi-domain-containing oxidoreductase [Smithella sp.]|nr:bi-domain-containing oxidoreductase [Smithella sp.]
MKAIIQNYGDGKLEVMDVPAPALKAGGILVRNITSLVSAGTEKLMVDLARKNLLGKAMARPDLVKQVIDKTLRDGIVTTAEAVFRKLDAPMPLGYSCAGTVIAVGEGVDGFQVGDLVACGGAGYANHADVVFIPKNLAAKVPEGVTAEEAAFTTLGAIALQGLRLADIALGETVAIIGLGLVGLLAAQQAKAAGCIVLGMDTNAGRCTLAKSLGVNDTATTAGDFQSLCLRVTLNKGVDKVIVAAGSSSNEPVTLAGEIARFHGTVVVVGMVGLEIPRREYYEKELIFRISRSYGPGRYDQEYEEKGRDYPFGYVRWTENRNMQAFLQLLAEGKASVKPLITHRFPIADGPLAYDLITGKTKEDFLGVLLTYPESVAIAAKEFKCDKEPASIKNAKKPSSGNLRIGMIGAGEFATSTLLPAMNGLEGLELIAVANATGASAQKVAKKFGFRYATTDYQKLIKDNDIDAVVIGTRHNLHGRQVLESLAAGKHVFLEKPLCVETSELEEIEVFYRQCNQSGKEAPALMVGFNRRFAPMSCQLKEFFTGLGEPLIMNYRVNAGYIPPEHWVHDPEQGGGRIIGEVCHFIDYLTFLAGAMPVSVYARVLPNGGRYRNDNLVVMIEFADRSIGTVTYAANGDKSFPKERVEVFGGGAIGVLDNFRRLEMTRDGKRKVVKSMLKQDKGHRGEWESFVGYYRKGTEAPIPLQEIFTVTRATFAVLESLREMKPVKIEI